MSSLRPTSDTLISARETGGEEIMLFSGLYVVSSLFNKH